ncbi:hypothetical protein SAY86_029033 [Trapa natans]|uniref:Uncharacterized protein n=1 Tax=Trapa natans TaxID=22666 RepID=A0AAN7M2F0_TRANT|nr:hypothetical protein SAY86_029033 [Trapa natans]
MVPDEREEALDDGDRPDDVGTHDSAAQLRHLPGRAHEPYPKISSRNNTQ